MRATLQDFLERYPELGSFLPDEAATKIIFAGENGEIYWANSSFLEWIGYSINEFVRSNNPVTWKQISVNDASLQADVEMARDSAAGEISQYTLRKLYVPKNQRPQLVELFVRRFPPRGDREFVFFVVEVFPMNEEHAKMAKEQGEFTLALKKLNESVEQLSQSNVNTAIRWLSQRPLIGVPVLLFIVYLLFGERAVEVFFLISEHMRQ